MDEYLKRNYLKEEEFLDEFYHIATIAATGVNGEEDKGVRLWILVLTRAARIGDTYAYIQSLTPVPSLSPPVPLLPPVPLRRRG